MTPKTSTDDQSVERVLQILEKNRRMTCEETAHCAGISRASAYRILTERLHKRRTAARWVPHDLSDVRELLDRYSWEMLPHPPFSPDMSPPDFDLFPKLKINMRGVRFSTLEDLRVVALPETRTASISTLCRFQVHTPPATNYTALAA